MRRSTTCVTLAASLVLAGGAAVAVPQSPDSPARTVAARAAAPERPVTHGAQDVCNYTIQRPTLRVGSAGNAVRQAQCYLNNSMTGRKLAEDGNFGSVTNAATRRFQQCAGITVDGTIGAQTWSFLVFWANSWRNVC